jgi:cell wall-associated NlpC family hydrolase
MPRFTAEQIYAFARQAGFSPDQSATMTAVALAESGGDSRSHATVGEDSRGLWQINAQAHPDLASRFDLWDPGQNAKAAFLASHGGTDVSPWTTTHGNLTARYLRFKDEAQQAAVAYGDGPNRGVWSGTIGYGHPLSPGDPQGGRPASGTATDTHTDGSATVVVGHSPGAIPVGHPGGGPGSQFGIPLENADGSQYGIPLDPNSTADATGPADPTSVPADPAAPHDATTVAPATGLPAVQPGAAYANGNHLQTFLDSALAQRGDRYIFGVQDNLTDPNPTSFDCSMLTQWAAAQAGVHLERTAWEQYRQLHHDGTAVSVQDAIHTPGALLFSFSSDPLGSGRPVHCHVAISLGNGKTIEALGAQYGVNSFDANTRRFQYAALVPGISDHGGGFTAPVPAPDGHGLVPPTTPPAHPPAADPHPNPPPGPHPNPHHDQPPPPDPGAGQGQHQDQDQFMMMLANDPDDMDTGAPGSSAPATTTPALDTHPATDPPHPPVPAYATAVDSNGDGLDDALQQANEPWTVPHPDTYPVDDGWDHHGHGGHH